MYVYIVFTLMCLFRRTRAPHECGHWPEKGRESGQRDATQGAEGRKKQPNRTGHRVTRVPKGGVP